MDIEDRLDELEDAHRALSAQHTALMAVCKMMLPLINADPGTVRQKLTTLYDTLGALMQEHGQDEEFQAMVRNSIDNLSALLFSAANIPPEKT